MRLLYVELCVRRLACSRLRDLEQAKEEKVDRTLADQCVSINKRTLFT